MKELQKKMHDALLDRTSEEEIEIECSLSLRVGDSSEKAEQGFKFTSKGIQDAIRSVKTRALIHGNPYMGPKTPVEALNQRVRLMCEHIARCLMLPTEEERKR